VKEGHQVMVFVHARKDTVKTAQMLKEKANDEGELEFFDTSNDPQHELKKRDLARSKNREMKELFNYGFGIHHAGMLRTDRTLTEKLFADGLIRVSDPAFCISTIFWRRSVLF